MPQPGRDDEHVPVHQPDGEPADGADRAGVGSHALGTGAGAGAGGAIGAALGATLGPAGAAVGATVGAVAGGAAGKAAAAAVHPSPAEEDSYWRDHYLTRPYADDTLSYDHYRPAYRYGWEARMRHAGRRWDEVERELERGWRENRGASRLGWSDARQAARDAWQRVEHRMADERERNSTTDAAAIEAADVGQSEKTLSASDPAGANPDSADGYASGPVAGDPAADETAQSSR
jgi:hypothetical protein